MDSQLEPRYIPPMKFLEKLRKKLGLTHYSMAKRLGMTQQGYIHLETRGHSCRLETLLAIRSTFGFTWEQLGKLIDDELKQ